MISIALPIHDMKNAETFLVRCLGSIYAQVYKDFEVVITDNSPDDRLKKIAMRFPLKIRYFINKRRGMAQNTNAAIKHSKGDLIKVLYMDDYLAHENTLRDIIVAFKVGWLITGSNNNPFPYYTDDIHLGNNHLGSPSALTILNSKPHILFDEKMTWLLDCDYYRRLYEIHGEPEILEGDHIVIGEGDHQMTHILTDEEKQKEYNYMEKKYETN